MTEAPVTAEARTLAEVLWDYLRLVPPLTGSDIILVLGSHDLGVAEHAVKVWFGGWAPLVVFSGGRGKVTQAWPHTEAHVFAEIAQRHGVPRAAMVLEETAENTGDNITRSRALLDEAGIVVRRGILVTKPYMARRAVATAGKQWPEAEWLVSTQDVAFTDYRAPDSTERRSIELMVGDLQRIRVYADRGFQTPMVVPAAVWGAYEQLVRLGFDQYVLTDPARS
ncbi:MAG: YdcF family protein [Actinomycetota bacterium]|nr:YdcF family protein [Actinomycetota bacterium]